MGVYYVSGIPYSTDYLMHFGIKGQKWGIRRFQNPDGTYTEAGLKRYRRFDAKSDLGYKPFQRLNNVQSGYTDRYKTDIKGYMKNTKKSNTTKRETKRGEYEREAKAFLARSETTKAMNQYYNSLFSSDKKNLNRTYKEKLIINGREAAHDYIDREMLRRKVSSDKQKDIWDRT